MPKYDCLLTFYISVYQLATRYQTLGMTFDGLGGFPDNCTPFFSLTHVDGGTIDTVHVRRRGVRTPIGMSGILFPESLNEIDYLAIFSAFFVSSLCFQTDKWKQYQSGS